MKIRTTFTPASRISAKSHHLFRPADIISIRIRLNGPYVTPLTKNLLSPSKKNFAADRILEFAFTSVSPLVHAQ